jgi:CheY-like chemotaxis protein
MAEFAADSILRIVITDDSENARNAIKSMLAEFVEADIFEASTGNECLQILGTGRFDALFVNLIMPGQDGFAVLRAISEGAVARPRFVAAVSGWSEVGGVRLAAEAYEPDAIIGKPFTLDDLQSIISQLAGSVVDDELLDSLMN